MQAKLPGIFPGSFLRFQAFELRYGFEGGAFVCACIQAVRYPQKDIANCSYFIRFFVVCSAMLFTHRRSRKWMYRKN
jgi:hypothetical protein